MLGRIVGLLIGGWGVLMAALAIARLVFTILTPGGISDIPSIVIYLAIGVGAMYVGYTIYRRPPQEKS
jgi:hypothetical protein